MVEPERIAMLAGGGPAKGNHVLYWMQHSQRAVDNPALSFALAEARRLDLPLLVLFVLLDCPAATAVHYRFMLAGLRETAGALRARGIGFALQKAPDGDPVPLVADWAQGKRGSGGRDNGDRHRSGAGRGGNQGDRHLGQSAVVVCDRGYLRHEEGWRLALAARLSAAGIPLFRVDADTVVPADAASLKLEWSAATLRRKIEGAIRHYAQPSAFRGRIRDAASLGADQGDSHLEAYENSEGPAHSGDRSPGQKPPLRPGTAAARAAFRSFLDRLDRYEGDRNDPNLEGTSGMSAYLHFGQISPAAMAKAALERGGPGAAAFVEQLVVRRELAINFCLREPFYDRYDRAVPEWARRSLAGAAGDRRPWIHGREALEAAATHDPYWNAAQNQLVRTGIIHTYMRMYWGKKILEWSASPEEAFATALYLNDRYALDGRDPSSYAGVAWCFGRHDRPWATRAVFGSIRYMNDAGLKRKFNREAYAGRWT
ncbi:MAG: deoxyribodipyrimidine photo-lyase [Spirochaetota bacterium]